MQSREVLKKHAALVDHMAETMGLDLEETLFRGQISTPEIEDAVLRCTSCTQPESCAHWLAQQGGSADAPPDYCRNTTLFDDLRQEQRRG